MKGFIEITLLLIIALSMPSIVELETEIKNHFSLFSRYRKNNSIESDLNYHLLNSKGFTYQTNYKIKEEAFQGKIYKFKQLSIENKLSKLIVTTDSNKIYNWKKFISSSNYSNNCNYEFLNPSAPIYFDCAILNIEYLAVTEDFSLANTGKTRIGHLELNQNAKIVSLEDLEINKIEVKKLSEIQLFSQLGEVKLNEKPACKSLNIQILDQNTTFSCFGMNLDPNFWPTFRIIATKLP